MLIVTTNAFDAVKAAGFFANWSEPHVLIILPGSGLSSERLEQLKGEFIIVECLELPESTTVLFCDIERWLRPLLAEGEAPLLWLDSPDQLPRVVDQSLGGEDALRAEISEDGRLVSLLLGEAISTSPLLPSFFDFIRGYNIDDRTLVDLLEKAFAWKPS